MSAPEKYCFGKKYSLSWRIFRAGRSPLFLFKSPVSAYRLYAFGRRLAEFGSQHVLNGLPLRFLTGFSRHKAVSVLSEAPERRLSLFLNRYGVPEQTLAFWSGLRGNEAGGELPDLMFRALLELSDFPESTTDKDQKRAAELLALFYGLELHLNKSDKESKIFERLLDNETDFRLEAALLERVNDFFYEDDMIRVALPEWFATAKNRLALHETPALRPFRDAPDQKEAALLLIRSLTELAFREGVLLPPFPAGLRADDRGRLYFLRARLPLFLKEREKSFLASFAEALINGKHSEAAKALSSFGYAAGTTATSAETLARLETEDGLTLAGKAERFMRDVPEPPLLFRYVAFVLKALEALCLPAFETNAAFERAVAGGIAESLPKEKRMKTDARETADRFRQAFSLLPHQLECLALQNKRAPAFLSDAGKVSEILSRQSLTTRIGLSRHRLLKILPLIAVMTVLTVLLILWKPF